MQKTGMLSLAHREGCVTGDAGAKRHSGGRRRFARGPIRPAYLQACDLDAVFFTLVNALGEISMLRDRLDTHETLAEQGLLSTREAVEAYRPNAATAANRQTDRARMLRRVLRVLLQDYEAAVMPGQDLDRAQSAPERDG